MMSSYAELELSVIQWTEDRKGTLMPDGTFVKEQA